MVALFVASLVTMGVLSAFVFTSRGLFVSEQRININEDIRELTSEMTRAARQANAFVLYKSFTTADRDTIADRLHHGESGDFIVFVTLDTTTTVSGKYPISRLVGYYRSPDNPSDEESTGPVRRFDVSFSTPSSASLESLIPASSTSASHREIVQISRGLADGKLFYNYRDRSAVVNGQIYHGNKAKEVTDTYNFTVSPRS
ncbi:MAG: hypothetical protein D6781_12905 [Verrucomicrobia bacterium]|nr:MAG: hypothetical protein D6781_12905 [Verrucomicrobiota bacterium]